MEVTCKDNIDFKEIKKKHWQSHKEIMQKMSKGHQKNKVSYITPKHNTFNLYLMNLLSGDLIENI